MAPGRRDVRDLRADFPAARTRTLMTTMERLHKRVVSEEKSGRAFVYRPISSRQELESAREAAIHPLLSGESAHPVLSCFVDE